MTKFEDTVEKLNKDPSDQAWGAFAKELGKSKAKYYKTFYPPKIKKMQDLVKSYVILYDAKYTILAKLPVYKKGTKGRIEGALIYLKGLEQNMVS